MKTPNPPSVTEHPDDLLLPYLEGRLTSQEKAVVEDHLRTCGRCMLEVEELGRLVGALSEKKRAFCPSASTLFDAAKSREEPPAEMGLHLSECAACREEFLGYQKAAREAMPRDLWRKIEVRVPEHPGNEQNSRIGTEESEGLWQRLMRLPAFSAAAAAAVAAVLLVVFLFPRDHGDLSVGLSSATWEAAPRPKTAVGGERKPVALVILFKDFPKTMPQKEIDALYQALEPTMELNERYRIVPPADLSRALAGVGKARPGKKEIVESLKHRLDISTVVLLTISPLADNFAIEADLVDATLVNSVQRQTAQGVKRSDLGARLKQEVYAVLLR